MVLVRRGSLRYRLLGRSFLACACALGIGLATRSRGSDAASPLRWRVIEPWLDPATGKGLFTHDGSVLTWDEMLHVTSGTPLGRYLDQVRRWGFNGISLDETDLEANPAAVRAVCTYLMGMGIRVFIHRDWREPELGSDFAHAMTDARPRASPLLNPYAAAVRSYWTKRVARDYQLVPGLAGYRLDGGEYYFSNGAPWMGTGPEMAGKTGKECVREAIQFMANELGRFGGTLVWETCQDDPWGQRQEYWYFQGLAGEIPGNAFILIKDYYWDFHPGWPRHPLAAAITRDAHGRAPYLTSIQLPGEYTGANDFPRCRVEHIAEVIRTIAETGQQGLWVAALPLSHPPWDHALNAVNWYALAEALRNPSVEPASLKLAWARAEFGPKASGTVVEVLTRVTEAAQGTCEFDGLWNTCHSRFPTLPYLDSHLCGPYRRTPRMTGMMGLILPLDMYPPEIEAKIRADPHTRLAFNQFPITAQLKSEAMAQKERAVQAMREAIDLWQSLQGRLEEARYTEILTGLKRNLADAIVFRDMMDLYMSWKLGRLTEAQIDSALSDCRGLEGSIVPRPLDPKPRQVTIVAPASLKTFAEELRKELRQPQLANYWTTHPEGTVLVEPEREEKP